MNIKETQVTTVSKIWVTKEEIQFFHIPPHLMLPSEFQGFYRRETTAVRNIGTESESATEIFWYQADGTTEVHNSKLREYLEREYQKLVRSAK